MSSGAPLLLPAGEVLQLKLIVTDVLVEALWLGVQAVVTVVGVHVLWSRGLRKSFGNKFLIGIIILLFCLAACCLSLTIWLYMSIFDELGGTLDVTTIQNNETIITTVFQRLAYFISDSIVVWRAWILWDRNIYVKMLLVVCLLGTITATFVQGALAVGEQIHPSGGIDEASGTRTLMFTLPLLLTNLCATILIAMKIWEYRRNIMSHLSGSKTRVYSILLILLESSVLYCICWILALLAVFGNIMGPIAIAAIMGSLPYVTSIYPIVVVVLVTLDKNDYGSIIQTSNTEIRFNHPGAGVMTSTTIITSAVKAPQSTFASKGRSREDFLESGSASSEKL